MQWRTTASFGGLVQYVIRLAQKIEDADPSQRYLFRSTCELSDGFLVFPNRDRGIEIWRRASDISVDTSSHTGVHAIPTPITLSPAAARAFQFEEAQTTAAQLPLGHSEKGLRGRYAPHAYIGAPHVGVVRIFRLRFPVLALMSSQDGGALLLFDVWDGTLLRRISSFDMDHVVGAPPSFALAPISDRVVMDLDVAEGYIAVCLHSAVVIVPRRGELKPGMADDSRATRILVLAEDKPPQFYREVGMQLRKLPDVNRSRVAPEMKHLTEGSLAWVAGTDALEEMEVVHPPEGPLSDDAQALVHVSGVSRLPPYFIAGALLVRCIDNAALTPSSAILARWEAPGRDHRLRSAVPRPRLRAC